MLRTLAGERVGMAREEISVEEAMNWCVVVVSGESTAQERSGSVLVRVRHREKSGVKSVVGKVIGF